MVIQRQGSRPGGWRCRRRETNQQPGKKSEQDTVTSWKLYEENTMAVGHGVVRRWWAHLSPCEAGTRELKLK